MSSQETYDVIILGSGLGGLACGVLLSKQGRRVLVLEKSDASGGCMQSYVRGGMRFDTGLHYVGGLCPGQTLHRAFDELGLMALPWVRMDDVFDIVVVGGKQYRIAQGYDKFISVLTGQFPHQQVAIRQYVEKLQHIEPADMDISAWQYLHELFSDTTLINVLSAPSMKIELRPDTLPLFSFLHAQKSYIEGSWRLQGDGSMMVDALTDRITAAGGRVMTGCEVGEVRVVEGRVQEVVTTRGEKYQAQAFISDIHPHQLCRMMQGNMPPRMKHFTRRMSAAKNTNGMFTTSLVIAPESVKYQGCNYFVSNTDDVWQKNDGVMVSYKAPEGNSPYVRQIDLLAPMSYAECRQWQQTHVGRRGIAYRQFMQQRAAYCIAQAERVIPGLSAYITHIYTSSPLTYRDYLSIPEGSAFGMRKDYRQSMMCYHSVCTPISNLFITGANVMLSGIEGVTNTAFETVRQTLKKLISKN